MVRSIAGALFDNIAKQPSAALALLLSKKEVDNVAVSSFGRPGQRMTTDAMALMRTALVAVVAAGAAFLPPPLEEIAPHLADADEEPAAARQRGPSGLFMKVASDEETALHLPVAGEAPVLVRARGRGGHFMRMVTAATSLPSLDSAAADLVAADWRGFCWMT